jgi:hypothetical protein
MPQPSRAPIAGGFLRWGRFRRRRSRAQSRVDGRRQGCRQRHFFDDLEPRRSFLRRSSTVRRSRFLRSGCCRSARFNTRSAWARRSSALSLLRDIGSLLGCVWWNQKNCNGRGVRDGFPSRIGGQVLSFNLLGNVEGQDLSPEGVIYSGPESQGPQIATVADRSNRSGPIGICTGLRYGCVVRTLPRP